MLDRNARKRQQQMRLFKPRFFEIDALFARKGRVVGRVARRQKTDGALKQRQNLGFVECAADADYDPLCRVAAVELGAKLRRLHRFDALFAAENLERIGTARKERRLRQLVAQIARIVFTHADFFQNHAAFRFNIVRVEPWMQQHIEQNLRRRRDMFAQCACIEVGIFLACVGVDGRTEAVGLLRNVQRGARLAALKDDVFQKVGDAVVFLRFKHTAAGDPHAEIA